MSEELKYIDYDEVLVVYSKTVAASGGGLHGVKDEGGIRKVLDFVQNDLYYPTLVEKLAYLVFGLCTGHYFEDGNKRVALTLGTYFLHKNGKYWAACIFMQRLEMVVYYIAAGKINKEFFQCLVERVLNGKDFTEEQKIALIHAIED